MTIVLALARPSYTKTNKNKANTDNYGIVGSDKINNKIANLSNSIKKMSSRVGFFTSKASLIFIQLRKVFTKALILYYFDLEHHI